MNPMIPTLALTPPHRRRPVSNSDAPKPKANGPLVPEMHTVYPTHGCFKFTDKSGTERIYLLLDRDRDCLMHITWDPAEDGAECFLAKADDCIGVLNSYAGTAVLLRTRTADQHVTTHYVGPHELPIVNDERGIFRVAHLFGRPAILQRWQDLERCQAGIMHYFHDTQGRLAFGYLQGEAREYVSLTGPRGFLPYKGMSAIPHIEAH